MLQFGSVCSWLSEFQKWQLAKYWPIIQSKHKRNHNAKKPKNIKRKSDHKNQAQAVTKSASHKHQFKKAKNSDRIKLYLQYFYAHPRGNISVSLMALYPGTRSYKIHRGYSDWQLRRYTHIHAGKMRIQTRSNQSDPILANHIS